MSLAAVIFDFDGILIDSETPEYESHRRIFERCGVALTTDEWCDQIGVWTEGHDERWFTRLRERSAGAPDRDAYRREAPDLRRGCAGRADARRPRAARRASRCGDPVGDRLVVSGVVGGRAVESLGIRPFFERSSAATMSRGGSRLPMSISRRRAGWASTRRGRSPSKTPVRALPPRAPRA